MKRLAPRRASVRAAAARGQSTAQRLAAAARAVAAVVSEGSALEEALLSARSPLFAAPDRAAVQALAFGTVRWYLRIARWQALLLERPGQLHEPVLRALLAVGLHQLGFSAHPPHAVVNETVEAARLLRHPRAAALVNAVLRRFTRERAAVEARALAEPEGRHAHPAWLIDRIRADWPQQAERVLAANNEQAPMWLRVNRRRITATDYLHVLRAHGIDAAGSDHCEDAVLLASPMDAERLPGFASGDVSVQDAAAQLAAPLLAAGSGMRVLDACAAPGGKTCHILERTPDVLELLALDRSRARLGQVEQNLERLGLRARVAAGDAGQPAQWWDGVRFHRILLDVSCSATGVIRRHPDIKLVRRSSDIDRLRSEQGALLRALWPLLEPGGRMLYATCSVLRAENQQVVGAFLAADSSALETTLPPHLEAVGVRAAGEPGVQILPGAAGMDGFYYACLERRD